MNINTKILLISGIFVFGVVLFFVFSNKISTEPQMNDGIPEDLTTTIMEISSSAFQNQENIPSKYTCDGANVNPPLTFNNIPETTESLLLIVADPDAPAGIWIHWTVWNIPPTTTEIPENSVPEGVEGTTSFENIGYGGPCPPSGTHRYFFKLFALDTTLELDPSSKSADIEAAMEGHIVETAELVGLYSKGS